MTIARLLLSLILAIALGISGSLSSLPSEPEPPASQTTEDFLVVAEQEDGWLLQHPDGLAVLLARERLAEPDSAFQAGQTLKISWSGALTRSLPALFVGDLEVSLNPDAQATVAALFFKIAALWIEPSASEPAQGFLALDLSGLEGVDRDDQEKLAATLRCIYEQEILLGDLETLETLGRMEPESGAIRDGVLVTLAIRQQEDGSYVCLASFYSSPYFAHGFDTVAHFVDGDWVLAD